MAVKDSDQFKIGLNHLQVAQIDIDLAKGTRDSLSMALQNAFKLSQKYFLEMEPKVWSKTAALSQREKEEVRKYYLSLKEVLLGHLCN